MDNALIVNLSISTWSGHKLDKTKTAELTDAANAEVDAARVNKHLVSKASLAAVIKAAGAVRQFFYRAALPWGDNGDRLLGTAGYMAFVDEFAVLKQEFDASVEEFIRVRYPAERARAQFRMGDMFVAADYPEPSELWDKFRISLDVHGVPTAQDLRVQLQEEDVQRLRGEIETANTDRLRNAMRILWERVFDTVSHFADRMQEDEKFREATVRNLHRLIDEVPALNITGDPALDALCEEIKTRLGGLDAKTLRASPPDREHARQAAAAIAQKMSGMMAGFGN